MSHFTHVAHTTPLIPSTRGLCLHRPQKEVGEAKGNCWTSCDTWLGFLQSEPCYRSLTQESVTWKTTQDFKMKSLTSSLWLKKQCRILKWNPWLQVFIYFTCWRTAVLFGQNTFLRRLLPSTPLKRKSLMITTKRLNKHKTPCEQWNSFARQENVSCVYSRNIKPGLQLVISFQINHQIETQSNLKTVYIYIYTCWNTTGNIFSEAKKQKEPKNQPNSSLHYRVTFTFCPF